MVVVSKLIILVSIEAYYLWFCTKPRYWLDIRTTAFYTIATQRDLARSPREKVAFEISLAARDLLLRDNLTSIFCFFFALPTPLRPPSLLVQFRRQNMETLLANCVEKNLTQFMFSNAIFLCERLLAQFPSEVSILFFLDFQFQFLVWLMIWIFFFY